MNKLNKLKQPIQIISDYILKFDGASKGNPGLGGIGAVLYYNNNGNIIEIWNISKLIGNHITNNEAEYHALMIGLEKANKMNICNLLVQGDSNLVIKQMNGLYQVRAENLIPLYLKCFELSNNIQIINFQHIYRNHNQRADELANESIYYILNNNIKTDNYTIENTIENTDNNITIEDKEI